MAGLPVYWRFRITLRRAQLSSSQQRSYSRALSYISYPHKVLPCLYLPTLRILPLWAHCPSPPRLPPHLWPSLSSLRQLPLTQSPSSCSVGESISHVRSTSDEKNPLLIPPPFSWTNGVQSALLAVTLGVLVGTSVLKILVWQITVPPAVTMLVWDIVHDWYTSRQTSQPGSIKMEQTAVTPQMGATEGVPPPRSSQRVQGFRKHFTPSHIASRLHTATTMLKRFPTTLVPFALLTFALVQGFMRKG